MNRKPTCRRIRTVLAAAVVLGPAGSRPALAGAPFAVIQGDQFVCNGQVIRLKGTNYYPRNHMWADMWSSWDWPAIQSETQLMRDLGLNCVRILVPYSHGGWNGPNVPASRLQQLEDIVNLMGENGIRSVVTLFDWETSFAAAGTSREADHIRYLSAIVGRLKDNPFVLFWDVKNEPDHPANYAWCDCNPGVCGNWDCYPAQRDKIVNWLHRMCDAVRARDPNHPAAAGMRWWENLPDVLGFVDVAIFHSYWPWISTREIPETKGYMGANPKPIVVEEWGWPTNPTPCNRDGVLIWDYTEANQLGSFVNHLTAFEQHDIAGGLQWMTFDAKPYTSNQNESFEHYFGLWRYGLSLKPAGEYYRDHFPVAPFPGRAPPTPTGFNAGAGAAQVRLTWQNPDDDEFAGVVIRYSPQAPPAHPADGLLLGDRPADPGTDDRYTHLGLTVGARYYYSLFAYDADRDYSEPVTASAVPAQPGDLDGDGDSDQVDFGLFQACISGAFVPQGDPACLKALMDADLDVDQADATAFQRCLTGPGVPASPACLHP